MGAKFVQHKIWKALAIIGLWLATLTCSQAGTAVKVSPAVAPDSEPLIQVNVYHLVVDPASRQPVVTLVDSDEKRAFPIWVGLSEARAIHSELQGTKHFRPLTHDLLAGIINKIDGKVHRVIITHAKDNVFYATLVIEKDDSLIEIDARPSDAIVMALKFNAPIYITRSLFEKMSIPMEGPQEVGEDYGLNIQEITPELAGYLSLESSRGVMVSSVHPGSQAEQDGIQPGDILVEIEGRLIADVISAKDFMQKSKGPVKAKLIREKQILTITLHLK
jgi:bifunctional DNase/RNase